MYADSVYPAGHYGATGLALEAGVKGKNLTEWQYGLGVGKAAVERIGDLHAGASPRLFRRGRRLGRAGISMDFFKTPAEMLSKLFLKGYQWPFDVRKVAGEAPSSTFWSIWNAARGGGCIWITAGTLWAARFLTMNWSRRRAII